MTSRPTHLLRHEHRVIEQALRAMNGMCVRLRLGDPVPQVALLKLIDFTASYTNHFHHEREEKYLFPALLQAGLDDSGSLQFLSQEHSVERDVLEDLKAALEGYELDDPASAERVIETCDRFAKQLISHMQREDSILFRIAEDLLDDETKHSLMLDLSRDTAELTSKYERMAAELENVWAV